MRLKELENLNFVIIQLCSVQSPRNFISVHLVDKRLRALSSPSIVDLNIYVSIKVHCAHIFCRIVFSNSFRSKLFVY